MAYDVPKNNDLTGIELDPAKTAHIAVHVQNYFFNPSTPRDSEAKRQPFVDSTTNQIRETALTLSRAGISTVWACMVNPDMGTEAKKLYKVQPQKGDQTVKGKPCSAMKCQGTEQALKDKGVDTVIISGGYASVCVTETVQDAVKAGFRVIVMQDCLVDNQDDMNLTGMFTSAANRPIFTTSENVLNNLSSAARRSIPSAAPGV